VLWPKAETLPKKLWKSELWKLSAALEAAHLNLRQPFNYGQMPHNATIIFHPPKQKARKFKMNLRA